MKYTLTWTKAADDELCELYLTVPDRTEFSRIVDAIEVELRRHPESVGESRDDGWRVVLRSHVGVIFEYHPEDCVVRILHVGWLP